MGTVDNVSMTISKRLFEDRSQIEEPLRANASEIIGAVTHDMKL